MDFDKFNNLPCFDAACWNYEGNENNYFVVFIVLVSISSIKAEVHPPRPDLYSANATSDEDDDLPVARNASTPPRDAPIDTHIL